MQSRDNINPCAIIMPPQSTPMLEVFEKQKTAFSNHSYPSLSERKNDLKNLLSLLKNNRQEIAEAINQDFSGRSIDETMTLEVMQVKHKIEYIKRNLRKWMKPDRRSSGLLYLPATSKVFSQPLGVVGVVSPWNYPLTLSLSPIAYALAAGNRVMLKPSEHAPITSELFSRLLGETFPDDKVAVVLGDAKIASEFTSLPFNHIFFTGSTQVGKLVMQSAASNLTPVTLEMGGKSPCIIGAEANISQAASRICFGKSINAGQTCIAPDYVYLPKGKEEEFVSNYTKSWEKMYPEGIESCDLTSIINEAQFTRLEQMLQDAKDKGAKVVAIGNTGEREKSDNFRMPTHLILNVNDEMEIMKEEIFGPLLPIKTYSKIQEVIEFVNSGERPLALYYFGNSRDSRKKILHNTHSGGVVFNDTVIQFAVNSLPFGGVGASGIGSYHGKEGFLCFSHERSVVSKGKINPTQLAYPPYGRRIHRILERFFIK